MTPAQRKKLPKYAQTYINSLEDEAARLSVLTTGENNGLKFGDDSNALTYGSGSFREDEDAFRTFALESLDLRVPDLRVTWEGSITKGGLVVSCAYKNPLTALQIEPLGANSVEISRIQKRERE